MPLIWRYLLRNYAKVLALSVVTFIAVLFVSRAKQIAQFASMGAGIKSIGLFALYLIPYVLPYAIPVSCLIASVILFQRLSGAQELTAMRATGLSLRQITGPILLAGAVMALLNFYIASELSTHSHMLGRRMEAKVETLNPINLLQNTQLLKFGDVYVDMRTIKSGEEAEDVTIALYNRANSRLNLIKINRLILDQEEVLHGEQVNLITGLATHQPNGFDHLIVEHQEEMWAPSSSLSHLIRRIGLNLKHSHLQLRLLLARLLEERAQLKGGDLTPEKFRELKSSINSARSEMARRVSLGLAAFTFTLLGCAFGIQVGRKGSRRGLIIALLLSTLFIACFSVAKELSGNALLSISLALIPHVIIIPLCIGTLKRITKGATA